MSPRLVEGSDPQLHTDHRHIRVGCGVESYSDDALQQDLPSLKNYSHKYRAGGDPLVEWLSRKSKHNPNNPQERFRLGMRKYVRAQVRQMDGAKKRLGTYAYDIGHDALLDVWETPVRHKLSSLCITAIRNDLLNAIEKHDRWTSKR